MSERRSDGADGPGPHGAYARAERERRFLLAEAPAPEEAVVARRITDQYLVGTRLRLRRVQHLGTGAVELKFTQKIPPDGPGPVQSWITNTYLSADEYDLLAVLPADVLTKTRYSVPPLGIDVFEGALAGLVMAEVEFASDGECEAFVPPPRCLHEVTTDVRFSGGRLVRASRGELRDWLGEYGIGVG